MSRFVILDHDHPEPHFDLMIESSGRLRTWRLLGNPKSPVPIPAEPLGDHRIEYLSYEGPVSGNRGQVVRWDGGCGAVISESTGLIVVRLEGARCRGEGEIREANGTWSFRWTQFRD